MKYLFLFFILIPQVFAAKLEVKASQVGDWKMGEYAVLAQRDPNKFFKIARQFYSKEQIKNSMTRKERSYDWQDRLAMIYALEKFLLKKSDQKLSKHHAKEALRLLRSGLYDDPSLLVRDASVETIRKVIRLNPRFSVGFKPWLEKAFMDSKNQIAGEGLFIRRTILITMQEGNIKLSKGVKELALRDKNNEVSSLAKNL